MAALLGWGAASGCLVSLNDDDDDVYYTSAHDGGDGDTTGNPGGPTTGASASTTQGPPPGTDTGTGNWPAPLDPDVCIGSPNAVRDPSFETGQGWIQSSNVFDSVYCDSTCNDDGSSFARSGDWWVWFGGTQYPDVTSVRQSVRFEGDAAVLTFHLAIAADVLVAQDTFTVRIDGQHVFSVAGTQADAYANYVPVRIDVGALADGAAHEIAFEASLTGTGKTSFFLEDVSIAACDPDSPADDTGDTDALDGSTGDTPAATDTDGEETGDPAGDDSGSTSGGEDESGDQTGGESTSAADTKDHSTSSDTSGE